MPPEQNASIGFQTQVGCRVSFDGRAVSPARLREWVRAARPGLRLGYGRGWHLKQACSEELAALVRKLTALGLVTPHQQRGEGPPIYFIQRTKRAVPPGAAL